MLDKLVSSLPTVLPFLVILALYLVFSRGAQKRMMERSEEAVRMGHESLAAQQRTVALLEDIKAQLAERR